MKYMKLLGFMILEELDLWNQRLIKKYYVLLFYLTSFLESSISRAVSIE